MSLAQRKLSQRQQLCLAGLPVDGSFAERGSLTYSTYCALQARGLVLRRRQGTGFAWARVLSPTPATDPSPKAQ